MPLFSRSAKQGQDVHGHAFAVIGQQLVDLTLGVLGGFETIDVRLLERPQIAQTDSR